MNAHRCQHVITTRRVALRRRASRRRLGFNLMEVLVAIGIFGVGMVAVAAVFPAALMLQRNTVQEVFAEQAARNARAMVKGRQTTTDDLSMPPSGPGSSFYNPFAMGVITITNTDAHQLPHGGPNDLFFAWSGNDRAYPRSTSEPGEARLYWVPFAHDEDGNPGTEDDISLYLFIVRREPGNVYNKPDTDPYYAYDDNNDVTQDPDEEYLFIPPVRVVAVTSNHPRQLRVSQNQLPGSPRWTVKETFTVGDRILTNRGDTWKIKAVGPDSDEGLSNDEIKVNGLVPQDGSITYFWYVPPDQPDNRSPAVDLIRVGGAVEAP